MHSHDRTILSKLGFDDRDKQNPLHDLACQYLVQPEQLARLMAMSRVSPKLAPGRRTLVNHEWTLADDSMWMDAETGHQRRKDSAEIEVSRDITRAETEMTIAKGEDRFKTVVGFVDATFSFSAQVKEFGTAWHPRSKTEWVSAEKCGPQRGVTTWAEEPFPFEQVRRDDCRGFIEVKIGERPVGDVLRQIKLYREFLKADKIDTWFVATAFKPSVAFVSELLRERVLSVTLGPKFHAWVEAQKSMVPAVVVEEM